MSHWEVLYGDFLIASFRNVATEGFLSYSVKLVSLIENWVLRFTERISVVQGWPTCLL